MKMECKNECQNKCTKLKNNYACSQFDIYLYFKNPLCLLGLVDQFKINTKMLRIPLFQ